MNTDNHHPHTPSNEAEISGELALLLGNAIRQQDPELLKAVIREVSEECSLQDGKWIFRTVGFDLTPDQHQWLSGAIAQLRSPEEA